MKILVTICARKGSKGLPSKNIKPFLGKPLIAHTIGQALAWSPKGATLKRVVVSTDGEEIAAAARAAGAEVPFMRPAELANDTIGKVPVLLHAFEASEQALGEKFDLMVDLDPTSPLRRVSDLDKGLETFLSSGADVCFSVTRARKNPYFNMVERASNGRVGLVKQLQSRVNSRQAAPEVFDMNASIYVYSRKYLTSSPTSLWDAKTEMFEMPPESAFDIDLERDMIITEALMKHYLEREQR